MAVTKKRVKARHVQPEALSSSSFEPFGYVIENPRIACPRTRNTQQASYPTGVPANQGSAIKYAEISPLVNRYSESAHTQEAKPVISLFACSPRRLTPSADPRTGSFCAVQIMERHPYTTQTFTPLGLDPHDTSAAYLVVVAPALAVSDTPDTEHLRAFLACGAQAVTYAAGTWHAPMIVLGEREVAFVVTQFVNGVAGDDCQEMELDAGLCVAIPELREFFGSSRSRL